MFRYVQLINLACGFPWISFGANYSMYFDRRDAAWIHSMWKFILFTTLSNKIQSKHHYGHGWILGPIVLTKWTPCQSKHMSLTAIQKDITTTSRTAYEQPITAFSSEVQVTAGLTHWLSGNKRNATEPTLISEQKSQPIETSTLH